MKETKARKFSKEQRTFIEAKALLEVTQEAMNKKRKEIFKSKEINENDLSKENIKRMVDIDMELEKVYDFNDVYKIYAEASDNVIQWALEQVKRLPQYQENRELLKVLDDKVTRIIHRDKLTEIAMSLVV